MWPSGVGSRRPQRAGVLQLTCCADVYCVVWRAALAAERTRAVVREQSTVAGACDGGTLRACDGVAAGCQRR